VQSTADRCDLLPARPAAWPTGRLAGLCTRNGLVVDLAWGEGGHETCVLHARFDDTYRIGLPPGITPDVVESPHELLVDGADLLWPAHEDAVISLAWPAAPRVSSPSSLSG
jgi:alpha-L-fucosidase 2